MKMPPTKEFDFQIYRLSDNFYNTYPKTQYIEILEKRTRPYNCIIFESSEEYFVCIPYRTNLNHKYAYYFKNTQRCIQHKSGLDYTKIVIIKDISFIDNGQVVIDQDEYVETVMNIYRIKDEAFNFLEDYKKHIKGELILHLSEFNRRYCYSPLKYFHNELNI